MRRLLVLALLPTVCGSLLATSYEYKPLKVPKANDVVLFTNGLPPATGERIVKTRKEILEFLRRGKNNLDVHSWYDLEYPNTKGAERMVACEGIFTDKAGRFYFWFLRTPTVLKLMTADGEYALLQLNRK
jgi:hypothetical protein